MFTCCSYWGDWSRVLSEKDPHGPFVEVNLTPIRNCFSSTWQNHVAPIRIRFHGTARSENDRTVAELPAEVRAQMVQNLGEELTNRLLTEDFLSQIDYNLYCKKCNGGANFEDIRKK
ncbi:MAG: hypothetical protein V1928_00690 [Parcubacteria group bacterium]